MNYPLPDRNLRIEEQPDVVLGAMLAIGEAAGEPDQGKLAALETVKNRAARGDWRSWGPDDWTPWKRVILRPRQYSAFDDQKIRRKMMNPLRDESEETWNACFRASLFVYHARNWNPLAGLAKGADYYFAAWMLGLPDDKIGRWVRLARQQPPLVRIGNHLFYELGADGLEGTADDLV